MTYTHTQSHDLVYCVFASHYAIWDDICEVSRPNQQTNRKSSRPKQPNATGWMEMCVCESCVFDLPFAFHVVINIYIIYTANHGVYALLLCSRLRTACGLVSNHKSVCSNVRVNQVESSLPSAGSWSASVCCRRHTMTVKPVAFEVASRRFLLRPLMLSVCVCVCVEYFRGDADADAVFHFQTIK